MKDLVVKLHMYLGRIRDASLKKDLVRLKKWDDMFQRVLINDPDDRSLIVASLDSCRQCYVLPYTDLCKDNPVFARRLIESGEEDFPRLTSTVRETYAGRGKKI